MSKLKSSLDGAKPHWRRLFWLACLALVTGLVIRFVREWQVLSASGVTSWEKDQVADCAVVLTGGPGRVKEGFDLLAEKKVKKLIISGVHPDARLRELLPSLIFYVGMKEEDVVLEKRSGTTWGNAQQSLPIVEALRCRDLLLVTSHLHMPRAYRTFRAVFPETIGVQTQAVVGSHFRPPFWEQFIETTKSLFYSLWAY